MCGERVRVRGTFRMRLCDGRARTGGKSLRLCSLLAMLAAGCRSAPDSPEAQIRALIAKAEKAAEEKDLATLKSLVSDRYSDEQRRDKRTVVGTVGYVLLRNKSIHLLTQVRTIEFPAPKQADCVVFVAMAARAMQGIDELSRLHADIYRVDFSAADEGTANWKVTRAEWRPAGIEDLDPGSTGG